MNDKLKALRICSERLRQANDALDSAIVAAELAGDKDTMREVQRLRRSSADLITNIDYRLSKSGRRIA